MKERPQTHQKMSHPVTSDPFEALSPEARAELLSIFEPRPVLSPSVPRINESLRARQSQSAAQRSHNDSRPDLTNARSPPNTPRAKK